jgi:molybdate transport system substrate-binding protein
MKKVLGIIISAMLLFSAAGCSLSGKSSSQASNSSSSATKSTELTVFAATSLTESLNELKTKYEASNSNVKIVFNFDSSGTLQKQIESGAEPDIFISAAKKQTDALEKGGYLVDGTRKDILKNTVVLIVPNDSSKGITSFEDCATDKVKLIALGNSDVPVGQYSEEIFNNLKIWDKVSAKSSLGTNVKEVLSQVENASADCGVVYKTDAISSKSVKIACTASEGTHSPVVYPAALVKTTKNKDAAKAFLDYLSTDEAQKVFETAGFTSAK